MEEGDIDEILRICAEMEASTQTVVQPASVTEEELSTIETPSQAYPSFETEQPTTPSSPPSPRDASRSTSPEPPVPHPGAFMWGDLGIHLWDVAVRNALVVLEPPHTQTPPESPQEVEGTLPGTPPHSGPPTPPLPPDKATGEPQHGEAHPSAASTPPDGSSPADAGAARLAPPAPAAASVQHSAPAMSSSTAGRSPSLLASFLDFYEKSLQGTTWRPLQTPPPRRRARRSAGEGTSSSTDPPEAVPAKRRLPVETPTNDEGVTSKKGRSQMPAPGSEGSSRGQAADPLKQQSEGDQPDEEQ
ncbi:hypothetical protein, conserved [Eimeria praecox]|uniref:Uncharacterized protein n=1 Tax=Eimeria praecox TaxID=51316 RepID=U6H665_9EIME|nr:hypothetical protein, conserved [Eimeria praecox]